MRYFSTYHPLENELSPRFQGEYSAQWRREGVHFKQELRTKVREQQGTTFTTSINAGVSFSLQKQRISTTNPGFQARANEKQ
jgi:hypothetical protein